MADTAIGSFFPAPPACYQRYGIPDEDDTFEPSELLPPPLDVIGTSYSSFGIEWPVIASDPTLEEQGIEKLYEDHEPAQTNGVLFGLLKKLLWTYLDLMKSLLHPPPSIAIEPDTDPAIRQKEHIDKLRLILVNMFYLLNKLRKQQAQDTLMLLFRKQIQETRNQTAKLNTQVERLEELLQR